VASKIRARRAAESDASAAATVLAVTAPRKPIIVKKHTVLRGRHASSAGPSKANLPAGAGRNYVGNPGIPNRTEAPTVNSEQSAVNARTVLRQQGTHFFVHYDAERLASMLHLALVSNSRSSMSHRQRFSLRVIRLALAAALLCTVWLTPNRSYAYHQLVNRGGAILATPEIAPVFVGTWAQSDIDATMAYLAALVDYMNGRGAPVGRQSVLRQYGVTAASLLPAAVVAIPEPYQEGIYGIDDDDILRTFIHQVQLMPGAYPFAPGRIVLVMTGGVPSVGLSALATHLDDDDNDDGFFALVPTERNPSTAGLQTAISHEIFEAATDPHPRNSVWGQGWIYWISQYCGTACLDPFNLLCERWCAGDTDEGADACDSTSQPLPFGQVSNFADNARLTCDVWSPAAQPVAGDFDGDGFDDIALVGGYRTLGGGHAAWDNVPIAYSNGAGYPRSTVKASTNMHFADVNNVTALGGDFDGDGVGDIAFVGGVGWTTMPVAFSRRDGTFRVVNAGDATFAGWAQLPGVQVVAADFNGDHRTDIALAGGPGWYTLPVALSNGDGSFTVDNYGLGLDATGLRIVSNFAALATSQKLVAGQFDGNGRAGFALVGAGWPISFLSYSTSPTTISGTDSEFVAWTMVPGVRPTTGDFDGDGRDDIALTAPGWLSVPIAFMNYDLGHQRYFRVQNIIQPEFGAWAGQRGVTPLAVHFSLGTRQAQLALVGGLDWVTMPFNSLAGFPYSQSPQYADARYTWNPGVADNSNFPNFWK
jgi:hypothetical protein